MWRGDGIAAKRHESDQRALQWQITYGVTDSSVFKMSSEDEDALMLVQLANLNTKNQEKKKKQYWVHPLWKKNQKFGIFNVYKKELNLDDKKFEVFYRMKKVTFSKLLTKLRPRLQKKDTNFRKCVSPEERLLVTLR